jgi:hypothetical protein
MSFEKLTEIRSFTKLLSAKIPKWDIGFRINLKGLAKGSTLTMLIREHLPGDEGGKVVRLTGPLRRTA